MLKKRQSNSKTQSIWTHIHVKQRTLNKKKTPREPKIKKNKKGAKKKRREGTKIERGR